MIGNLPAFSFFFFKFLTLVSLPFYFSLYLYLLFVYSNTYIVYSYYINFRKLFLKKQNLILYKLYKKYSELKSDFLISMLISYCIISLSFPFFIDFLFI